MLDDRAQAHPFFFLISLYLSPLISLDLFTMSSLRISLFSLDLHIQSEGACRRDLLFCIWTCGPWRAVPVIVLGPSACWAGCLQGTRDGFSCSECQEQQHKARGRKAWGLHTGSEKKSGHQAGEGRLRQEHWHSVPGGKHRIPRLRPLLWSISPALPRSSCAW